MSKRTVHCPHCRKEFVADGAPGIPVSCPSCKFDFNIPSARHGSNPRPHAAGAKKPAHHMSELTEEPKGKRSPFLFVGIGGALAIAVVAFAMTRGEEKQADPAETTIAEAAKPKISEASDNDIFSVGGSSAAKTDEAKKGEQRVVGREPTTVKIEELTQHLGKLYTLPETAAAIQKLKTEVEDAKNRRVDLTSEQRAQFDRLVASTDKERLDPFLSEAESELWKYNNLFEKREIHQRDKSGELYPAPFVAFAHKPFVIFVQRSSSGREKEIADEVVDQLRQLKEEFITTFGKFLKLDEKKNSKLIKVMLLRSMADYNAYNRIKDPKRDKNLAVAHYEPGSRLLVVPLEAGEMFSNVDPEYGRKAVMFHEGTHQLVHCYSDQDHLSAYGSMWSDEGVAEYFAGFSVGADGKYIFRKLNMARLPAVVALGHDHKRRLPLTTLASWTRAREAEEESKENFSRSDFVTLQVYALGWAFVEFLNSYDAGKYEEKFEQIMKLQFNSGDTGLPILNKVFPNEELEKVEQEFNKWVDDLVTAARENRIYDGRINTAPKTK